MSLAINELKQGRVILWNNEPYIILEYQHARTAQRRAFVRTKLKNLKTGSTLEKTFNASDKVEEAELQRSNANFLYKNGNVFNFMDEQSYEEVVLPQELLGLQSSFLTEGMKVAILSHNEQPISVELPKKVRLKIKDTMPAVKGDTVSGSPTKVATLENGYEIQVPFFIESGEEIIVNTENGDYVERAKKESF